MTVTDLILPPNGTAQTEHIRDRIRALGAQEQAHKDMAAALRREITTLQRQLSSVDSSEQNGYSTTRNR